jgi:hypothetical protein
MGWEAEERLRTLLEELRQQAEQERLAKEEALRQLEQVQRQAEQERLQKEEAQRRAELLAERLRAAGLDPNVP